MGSADQGVVVVPERVHQLADIIIGDPEVFQQHPAPDGGALDVAGARVLDVLGDQLILLGEGNRPPEAKPGGPYTG